MSGKTVTLYVENDGDASGGRSRGTGRRPKKHRKAWIIAVIAVVVLFVCAAILSVSGILGGNAPVGDYVAVLDIDGEIEESSGSILSGTSSYNHEWMMDEVKSLEKDGRNKGILLRINTPGGSAYLSDEMYTRLMEYRKKTGRPVYTYMESEACSGGYYIASASSRIYANRNTWTGSIGVTTGTMYNIKGLLNKLGITATTITSGRNKAMGSSTEKLTSEQREIIQSLIDEAYDQFVGVVAKGRGMSVKKVKKIADGRVYTARQAKRLGLIDGIMTEEQAKSRMKKNEKLTHCSFREVAPDEDSGAGSFLSSVAGKLSAGSDLSMYKELMSMAKSRNIVSVEYISQIRK